MATQAGATNHMSLVPLQSGQTLSLAKTLQVQDQIIEQLRADQVALREALEVERNALKECRFTSDRELKALQREKIRMNKLSRQQEMKVEDLEKELALAKENLAFEQKNLKALEKEHANIVKELKVKASKDFDKCNKQEMMIDQLKSEVEDLKEALQSERNATNLLIREHNAEVKMLREEVKNRSSEAYRELKERATREREEYRQMEDEAEKIYKVLERDFREALASKDEELKKVKAEARVIQRELEDQLRASLKEPSTITSSAPISADDYVEMSKFRRLKNELSVVKEQNRKLLNEIQLLTEDGKMNELTNTESYIIPDSNLPLEKISSKVNFPGRCKRSFSSIHDKGLELEITRMASDYSVNKNFAKRQAKSALSMKREEGLRPRTKSKTEEHYEELKRTMQILRKALQ